jgi:hypothetical protein
MTKFTKLVPIGMTLVLGISTAQAVDFGVFGDVNYHGWSPTTNVNKDIRTCDCFAQGEFDMYLTQKIDPVTKVFVEMVYEDGGDGGNGYGVDLERYNISRDLTPNFTIGMGRYHTPIGYWNTAYHHGYLLSDTVSRPSFLNFEDGMGAILPMHTIGLMGNGSVQTASGDIEYDVMVGNSTSINTDGFTSINGVNTMPPYTHNILDVNNILNPGDKLSENAKVVYKFAAMPLQVGVFAMHQAVSESGTVGSTLPSGLAAPGYGGILTDMMMSGGHFRYAAPKFDVLGEYYNLQNQDKVGTSGTHSADAYYIQFGYRLTNSLKPVYRYEAVNFSTADPYFQYLGTQKGGRHVIDLRWDLSDTNAIKLEFTHFVSQDSNITSSYNSYSVQWAFMLL